MKHSFLFLGLLITLAKAELPQMAEKREWMGYFIGWTERGYDYGFGADGEGILFPKKGKERQIHDDFKIRFRIQQKRGGKWGNRSAVEWSTKAQKALNPKKPVAVILEAKGGTKAEFLQTRSSGRIIVKPKFLEKTTKDDVRMVVEIAIRDFYRLDKEKDITDKKLKKILKNDTFEAKRSKDNKRVSFKLYEKDIDLTGEKMLAEGASEVTHEIKRLKKALELRQGDPKAGRFEIVAKGPLYLGYKILWIIEPEKAGKKDAYMSFTLK